MLNISTFFLQYEMSKKVTVKLVFQVANLNCITCVCTVGSSLEKFAVSFHVSVLCININNLWKVLSEGHIVPVTELYLRSRQSCFCLSVVSQESLEIEN